MKITICLIVAMVLSTVILITIPFINEKYIGITTLNNIHDRLYYYNNSVNDIMGNNIIIAENDANVMKKYLDDVDTIKNDRDSIYISHILHIIEAWIEICKEYNNSVTERIKIVKKYINNDQIYDSVIYSFTQIDSYVNNKIKLTFVVAGIVQLIIVLFIIKIIILSPSRLGIIINWNYERRLITSQRRAKRIEILLRQSEEHKRKALEEEKNLLREQESILNEKINSAHNIMGKKG
jgi:hypothetical protein